MIAPAMEPTRFQRRIIFAVLVLVLLAGSGALWWLCAGSDSIAFLSRHSGAEWIIDGKPADADTRLVAPQRTIFKRSFVLKEVPPEARVTIRAFKSASVTVNGRQIDGPRIDGKSWKKPTAVPVAAVLVLGTNEIAVSVTNNSGPPALWLQLQAGTFSLGTDESWRSSPVDSHWLNARRASAPPELAGWLRPDQYTVQTDSLRRAWPEMVVFTIVSLALVGLFQRGLKPRILKKPATFVYSLLAVIVVMRAALCVHDIPLLPHQLGFDAEAHEAYVRFIQVNKALPLPNDGWEMHQPPLYYLGAAAMLNVLGLRAGSEQAVVPLRAMNGFIGLLECWLVLLCLRRLFPNCLSAQVVGLLVAGFVPANLCVSLYVGNDALAELSVTLALYLFLRLIESDNESLKLPCALGFVLGLAVLAKLTALIAVPLFLGAMGLRLLRREMASVRRRLRGVGVAVLVFVLTSGWHYVRVWRQIGALPLPNSQTSVASAWWQDPGFRTTGYYLGFGHSLASPQFSAGHSFADGIYSSLWADGLISGGARLTARPPWNYALQHMSCLLGVGLTFFLLCGMAAGLRKFIRTLDPLAGLLSGMIIAFVAGLVFLTLASPWLVSAKAWHALPALAPFSALIASGWMVFAQRKRLAQTALWLLVLIWSFTAFCSFWVRTDNHESWRIRAVVESSRQNAPAALDDITRALQLRPEDAYSRFLMAGILNDEGRTQEAVREYEESVRLNPDSPESLVNLALLLAGGRDEGNARARAAQLAARACELTEYRHADYVGTLAWTQIRAGRIDDAVATFDLARDLAVNTGKPGLLESFGAVLNGEAWAMATSPVDTERNGRQGVQLAQCACEMTGYGNPVFLGTLAAAYAEAGRFDDAVAVAQRACDLAGKNGESQFLARSQALLEFFRAHKPVRPFDGGGTAPDSAPR